ncbi:MAG: hypothetical protein V7L01_28300 [Nostoc sp.]|uniref:hypothetical protein n=1 Tax=Nostoc sp. TaxID=1180 RepID=UPI002FF6CC70
MRKDYYYSLGSLGASDFHRLGQRNCRWESTGLQIKRSPVCLIAHHKITALLTPLLHGRGVMLNEAIPV